MGKHVGIKKWGGLPDVFYCKHFILLWYISTYSKQRRWRFSSLPYNYDWSTYVFYLANPSGDLLKIDKAFSEWFEIHKLKVSMITIIMSIMNMIMNTLRSLSMFNTTWLYEWNINCVGIPYESWYWKRLLNYHCNFHVGVVA